MPLIISPNIILPRAGEVTIPADTPQILWDNKLTTANIESSVAAATNYPLTNLANPATNLEWRANAAGALELRAVGVGLVDAVGIARHNFGSTSKTVEVGYLSGSWVSLAGPVIPANDEPLLFRFAPTSVAKIVVKLSAGTAAARAAVLYVGTALVMQRSVDINPDYAVPRFARRTEFQAGCSDRGDYLGRIVTSQWLDGIEHVYKHITPDWYRDELDPFIRAAQKHVPFFYAFQPDEYPFEVGYLWLQDDPIAMTSPATRRINLTLRMGGILE